MAEQIQDEDSQLQLLPKCFHCTARANQMKQFVNYVYTPFITLQNDHGPFYYVNYNRGYFAFSRKNLGTQVQVRVIIVHQI